MLSNMVFNPDSGAACMLAPFSRRLGGRAFCAARSICRGNLRKSCP